MRNTLKIALESGFEVLKSMPQGSNLFCLTRNLLVFGVFHLTKRRQDS